MDHKKMFEILIGALFAIIVAALGWILKLELAAQRCRDSDHSHNESIKALKEDVADKDKIYWAEIRRVDFAQNKAGLGMVRLETQYENIDSKLNQLLEIHGGR
tara:strand:+ start:535 stop:843 length:309 start_codon:yes stop_codon:yes gene_type:complete